MKKFLVAMGLVAFAVVGCDDDSWSPSDADNSRSSSVIPGSDPESSGVEEQKSSSSSANKVASSSSSLKSESSSSDENSQSSSSKDPELAEESFTDTRDGRTYKTVTIGDQVWMAENLNYETGNSYCYNNNSANCTKYGRLYTWAAAMDSVGTLTTNGKGCGYKKTCSPTYPVRGICPEGWHLPSKTEFETLFTAVGGQDSAGTALKSTGGWFNDGNGTDAFGFSALPAGDRGSNGGCNYEGLNAYFWSSTEYDSNYAYNVLLYVNFDYAYLDYGNKDYGFSVRCLTD